LGQIARRAAQYHEWQDRAPILPFPGELHRGDCSPIPDIPLS
jgi:hypothetical protein